MKPEGGEPRTTDRRPLRFRQRAEVNPPVPLPISFTTVQNALHRHKRVSSSGSRQPSSIVLKAWFSKSAHSLRLMIRRTRILCIGTKEDGRAISMVSQQTVQLLQRCLAHSFERRMIAVRPRYMSFEPSTM
ncbi:hypothetical protein KVT40_009234 [Elsinoe batatas]|uniref:Uncharacterized protein n=1 Tax=Elsinoe batatas TaxID=2601811 RepID=A0A8K0KSX6_9PEZI|nr:hypothetical protein KVT40_009234 [Elsinoe batatas]